MRPQFCLLALLAFGASALAQAPATPAPAATPAPPGPAAAGTNVVVNGNFAKFNSADNLWDGVDSQGFLSGWRRGTYALAENGISTGFEPALSVDFADINGDQLMDLITADALGYLRAYINRGTKTEPKYDHSEIIPLFPPQIAKDNAYDRGWWTAPHGIPKINMFDWGRRGALDLTIGNYGGDILIVPNTGSAQAPAYAQPTNYAKVKVPTASKRQWGNLFAPYAIDWNKDGKTDLLVGEGSYSANAVYVMLNQSGSNIPSFSDEQRFYLCYGDGREHLVPTVADWNGDGNPDVLAGDRLGTVGVYLNPGNWKPGVELKFATNVKFGTVEKLGAAVAPNAADFNGDGLFDLVIGKSTGRLGIAVNKGTKTEPKFDPPVELKGTDLMTDKVNSPTSWTIDVGNSRGNIYAYASVDPNEASPGGGKVLKFAFYPTPNKVFKMVPLTVNGRDVENDFFRYWREEWEPVPAHWAGWVRTADAIVVRQTLSSPLKIGSTYTLSFKARGAGFQNGISTLAYLGAAENVATKYKKTDRGVKADKDETHEIVEVSENFTPGGAWKTYQKDFTIGFKERVLKKLDATTLAIVEFKFNLPQYSATCDLCDVQIIAKPAK